MRNFHRSSTGKFILSILRSTSIQITIYAVLQWVTIYMKFIWQIQLCIVIQVQMIHKWLFGLSGIFFILLKNSCIAQEQKQKPFFVRWKPLVWKREWQQFQKSISTFILCQGSLC